MIQRLSAGDYYLLRDYVTPGIRDDWVQEVEDFLTEIAPFGIGDARGTTILLLRNESGEHVAAAAYRLHHRLEAIHLQAFVVRPHFRGLGLGVSSFIEFRDEIRGLFAERPHVTWSVRRDNVAMLRVSRLVGVELAVSDEFVRFVFP